ncbi:MAG: GatB/YqeY domain-containing protein [Candidatus Kuenenbacteria bacterium]
MSLQQKIEDDFKKALLARNQPEVDLLRLVKSAIKNEMIRQKKQELPDSDILKVIKKESKKRQDSIQLYMQGNRPELADKEQAELALIKKYMPEEMSEEEVKKIVRQVISEIGDTAHSQFGQIMSSVMKKTDGKADGKIVSNIVRGVLAK